MGHDEEVEFKTHWKGMCITLYTFVGASIARVSYLPPEAAHSSLKRLAQASYGI